jgi:hypothetical protein
VEPGDLEKYLEIKNFGLLSIRMNATTKRHWARKEFSRCGNGCRKGWRPGHTKIIFVSKLWNSSKDSSYLAKPSF